MERVPEPELMDSRAQAAAYAAADFSVSDQAVIERLAQLFPAGLGGRVVDLGCGPGNISFRLAAAHPTAQVLGIDGAGAMLELAERELARQGQLDPPLAARLRFQCCQLPDPQLAGGFSAVVSNSLLHHLHRPAVLWSTVRHMGGGGAAVYIKDLRRPASLEAAEALRHLHMAGAPAVLQHDYLASLRAAFTPEEVISQLEAAGLQRQLQVAPLDDRYLEVWGRLD